MISWVLILSMVGGSHAAILAVPGFRSEAECKIAAKVWLASMDTYYTNSAVCVLN